jgi:hypothetical protein
VKLFEEIRRGYAAGETISGLAKKHGVHRRMVRQAVASAIPAAEKEARTGAAETGSGERGHRPDVGRRPDGAAQATAYGHRIWTRLRKEHPGQPKRPCGDTCSDASRNSGWPAVKCLCRRATTGAKRHRWIGSRRWRSWTGNRANFSSLRCGVKAAMKMIAISSTFEAQKAEAKGTTETEPSK